MCDFTTSQNTFPLLSSSVAASFTPLHFNANIVLGNVKPRNQCHEASSTVCVLKVCVLPAHVRPSTLC